MLRWWWRLETMGMARGARGSADRVDRAERSNFGLGRKKWPEMAAVGWWPEMVAGKLFRWWQPENERGRERMTKRVQVMVQRLGGVGDSLGDDEEYLVMVPTCRFKHLNIPLFSRCASLSLDDEDEEEMTGGEAIFFPFSVLGFLEKSYRSKNMFMKCEPSNWDNGLRIYSNDMIVKTGQKHGKRHGTFAFLYDFLHLINNHRSEVELSSNG
ncbi:hypothetical protein Tco_1214291 [Tanacetum coccineum]